MKFTRGLPLLIFSSCIVFCAVFSRDVRADMEGRMTLSKIQLDSAGLDTSGPVHVEANQSDHGITQLKVSAFGKVQTLTPSQLASLGGHTVNTIGLSYSRGYPNVGGRSVYLLLCQGFSSAVKVVAVITVTEQGGVRVDDVSKGGP
jgi:hypothetical protein